MDTKECKKNALEEVKRTIERRNANILKGQVSDGAIGNPIYRIDIMEEIRALTSIKKMGSGTLSKVMQSGTVNIRSSIKDNTKSSRNRGAGRCRKAHTPSIKSVVFTASGNMVGSNTNVVKQLMSGSGSQSSKLPAFEGGWIDCGNPIGSKSHIEIKLND